MARKKAQNRKGRKAGWLGFGATAMLYALLFPLYRLSDLLLCGALALLVSKLAGIMGTGLDLTTHNKPQPGEKVEVPVEELPLSGDSTADAVIAKGQEMLHQIRSDNDAIPDEVLSRQMDELERLCTQIFKTVAEKPSKAPQIRKFMNYYLPTTLKMLASYRTMEARGVSVTDMTHARSETIRGMNMILTACQKQLDNLYKDTMLDVSTDIDVLEQMLKRDGLTDSDLARTATATAAQMNELERLCVQIFKTVAEKPNKAPQIRKFMNYYLPTTLKMLASYRTMDSRGVSATDMAQARSETIRGMNLILTACQKQLDNLYKDTMLDVSTDIDVLEQMLKRDGYTDGAFSSQDATAAAAQMNATKAPTIATSSSDDDFVSFYDQQRNQKK